MDENNFTSSFEGKSKSLKFITSIWPEGLSPLFMKMGVLSLITGMLLFNACVKGYDDEWTFSSGVEGVTLDSPKAEDLIFTPSADGATVKVEWPVIYGAGGYQFSLYIVDDPDSPVAVGVENQFVDGCSASRELLEDTRYKVVLKTLGNEKSNNKEASVATEVSYSTLLTATVIPNGTDLAQYFSANPIIDSGSEIGYELEAGGTYTMSGEVNFGTANVTLRGDKIDRPIITMSAGFKAQGGGTKFKFIIFECAGIPTDGMFYGFSDLPAESELTNGAVMVTNPITFQSCRFNALPVPLYWDNGKNYAVQTLLIKDCIAELTDNGRFIRNSASKGSLKDFVIANSTVYKNNTGTDFWMQLSTGQRITSFGWVTGSFTYTNNTFYGFDRMHNSNQYAQSYITTIVRNCLFLDMLREPSARYILPGNRLYKTEMITFDKNTYWMNGAAEAYSSYDKSGTSLDEDPGCANPAGGDFTLSNPNTIGAGIGDPRWL